MPSNRSQALEIAGSLEVSRRGQRYLGGNRVRLLEAIERTGSISQAARDVGMSYKGAWDAVDAMNNLAERALLVRTPGGSGGGGSRLTEHGRQIVQLYRLLESGYQRLLGQMQTQMRDIETLGRFLRAISVKSSARNQYHGLVKTVRKGAVNAEVLLDLGDDLQIVASITKEAVQELQLRRGREATALIKSSFVLLSTDLQARTSARNRLRGKVVRIIRGAVNSEVVLELPGGRRLIAMVTNESCRELQLAPGSECCALIKASHVILAVGD